MHFKQILPLYFFPLICDLLKSILFSKQLFQRILNEDKVRHAGNLHGLLMGPEVRIRRSSLYQDAFDELSGDQGKYTCKLYFKFVSLLG